LTDFRTNNLYSTSEKGWEVLDKEVGRWRIVLRKRGEGTTNDRERVELERDVLVYLSMEPLPGVGRASYEEKDWPLAEKNVHSNHLTRRVCKPTFPLSLITTTKTSRTSIDNGGAVQ